MSKNKKNKLKNLLIILLSVFFVIAAWFISVKNEFGTIESIILSSSKQINKQIEEQQVTISQLARIANKYLADESKLFLSLTKAQTNLSNAKSISNKIKASHKIDKIASELINKAKDNTKLKKQNNFNYLKNTLEKLESRTNQEKQIYNENVKLYNINLQKMPKHIVADFYKLKPKEIW
jgi:LemA protein